MAKTKTKRKKSVRTKESNGKPERIPAKPKTKVTVDWEFISADRASRDLDNRHRNRRINERVVDIYEADMAANNWMRETGETIKYDVNGQLIDGQKRLAAVKRLGKGDWFLVARNLPEKAIYHIDTGQKRSLSDAMRIAGISYYTTKAAMVPVIAGLQRGKPRMRIGVQQGLNVLDRWQREINSATKCLVMNPPIHKAMLQMSMPVGGIGGIYCTLLRKRVNKEELDQWTWRLITGEHISINSPVYKMRAALIANSQSLTRMRNEHMTRLLCASWNAYRQNNRKWDAKLTEKILTAEIVLSR